MVEEISFYVMAAPALRGLLDEFRLAMGDDEAGAAMYRYGQRCGMGMVESMEIEGYSVAEIVDDIALLISESGLGYGKASEKNGKITVELSETLEPAALEGSQIHNCNFTRGYLSGILSSSTRYRFGGVETTCKSRGDGKCTFEFQAGQPAPPVEKGPAGDIAKMASQIVEKIALERGLLYMEESEKPDKVYTVFSGLVSSGSSGLCITREFPKRVRAKHGLEDTKMIWLSTAEEDGAFDPTKLSALYYEIQMFLKENPRPAILLSGVEYMVAQNNFLTVLKFIQLLSEQAAIHDGFFLLPLNPGAFDGKDFNNLKQEMMELP